MSAFFTITAQTSVFPVRFTMANTECTVVIAIWADFESAYEDMASEGTELSV